MDELARQSGQGGYIDHRDFFQNYSPEELSGALAENGSLVRFGLLPINGLTVSGTAEERQLKLRELQKEHPEIDEPSLLETIMWWYYLRAPGFAGPDRDLFMYTPTYFCKLPPHEYEVEGQLVNCVPAAAFLGMGMPALSCDPAHHQRVDLLCFK